MRTSLITGLFLVVLWSGINAQAMADDDMEKLFKPYEKWGENHDEWQKKLLEHNWKRHEEALKQQEKSCEYWSVHKAEEEACKAHTKYELERMKFAWEQEKRDLEWQRERQKRWQESLRDFVRP